MDLKMTTLSPPLVWLDEVFIEAAEKYQKVCDRKKEKKGKKKFSLLFF
jgi:hypothetical protein